jgi:hypothetical protein
MTSIINGCRGVGVALGVGVSVGGVVAVGVADGSGLGVNVVVYVGLATVTSAVAGNVPAGSSTAVEATVVTVTSPTSLARSQAARRAIRISEKRIQTILVLVGISLILVCYRHQGHGSLANSGPSIIR